MQLKHYPICEITSGLINSFLSDHYIDLCQVSSLHDNNGCGMPNMVYDALKSRVTLTMR
jgi:hypothetical protein